MYRYATFNPINYTIVEISVPAFADMNSIPLAFGLPTKQRLQSWLYETTGSN